jgi:hypothetical protein
MSQDGTIDNLHCLPCGLNNGWCVVGACTYSSSTRHGSPTRQPLQYHVKFDLCLHRKSTASARESGHMGSSMAGMLRLYCFPMFQIFQTAQECLHKCVGTANYSRPLFIAPMAAASSRSRCSISPQMKDEGYRVVTLVHNFDIYAVKLDHTTIWTLRN